jgi:hypothetical protein
MVSATLMLSIPACSHARQVEEVKGKQGATADPRGNPEITSNPDNPLVVDAPEKFLRPGGGRLIKEALRKKGFVTQPEEEQLGASTTEAIVRIQWENDLATTGFPDAETLRLLDLNPDDIYKSPLDERQVQPLMRKQQSEAREVDAKRDQE